MDDRQDDLAALNAEPAGIDRRLGGIEDERTHLHDRRGALRTGIRAPGSRPRR
ncbi:hypothetical protein [Spirillospora sp. NPDC047279]|uniref:hypothetical protein n=1 Tax=Spirillospora sp. NPDC047279 TaxID=3155478 RepID=UPI0033C05A90